MPASQASGCSTSSEVACHQRRTSSGVSRTRNAQPWLKPALGARVALASARSTIRGSTGVSAYVRIIRRWRTTSWNSMGGSMPDDFERMWADLAPLGRSSASGGYFRQPYLTAETELRAWFVEQATARGLRVESDPVGNLVAWWSPPGVAGPGVVTGSHLDSVLDGGAYDGPLGVVSALAAVDVLRSQGFVPAKPIGVSVFVEEEGARFGLACLGSRLAAGAIDWQDALRLRDRDGVSFEEALASAGLGATAYRPWD